MKDKFSLYQADGFWGIIEDASDEKQTSVKSYIGPDLIVKRLNEQAKQIEELNQRLVSKDKYIDELENDLNWERGNKLTIHKQFADRNCYVTLEDYKADIAEKDKELLGFKRDRLYFELLLTRLQWLHKKADDYRLEKERFGVDNISLSSVWDVLELQKNDLCEYEEMVALQEGIECIANSKLLADIEHDLQVKATRSENEIFKDIEQIDQQIKELKGEKDE